MLSLLPKSFDEHYFDKLASIYTEANADVTLGHITLRHDDGRIAFGILRKYEVEQDGADQPAAAEESKPD